jgi:hypothetical protein
MLLRKPRRLFRCQTAVIEQPMAVRAEQYDVIDMVSTAAVVWNDVRGLTRAAIPAAQVADVSIPHSRGWPQSLSATPRDMAVTESPQMLRAAEPVISRCLTRAEEFNAAERADKLDGTDARLPVIAPALPTFRRAKAIRCSIPVQIFAEKRGATLCARARYDVWSVGASLASIGLNRTRARAKSSVTAPTNVRRAAQFASRLNLHRGDSFRDVRARSLLAQRRAFSMSPVYQEAA